MVMAKIMLSAWHLYVDPKVLLTIAQAALAPAQVENH